VTDIETNQDGSDERLPVSHQSALRIQRMAVKRELAEDSSNTEDLDVNYPAAKRYKHDTVQPARLAQDLELVSGGLMLQTAAIVPEVAAALALDSEDEDESEPHENLNDEPADSGGINEDLEDYDGAPTDEDDGGISADEDESEMMSHTLEHARPSISTPKGN
jgi:hypothetical protein